MFWLTLAIVPVAGETTADLLANSLALSPVFTTMVVSVVRIAGRLRIRRPDALALLAAPTTGGGVGVGGALTCVFPWFAIAAIVTAMTVRRAAVRRVASPRERHAA